MLYHNIGAISHQHFRTDPCTQRNRTRLPRRNSDHDQESETVIYEDRRPGRRPPVQHRRLLRLTVEAATAERTAALRDEMLAVIRS
jgi:hypothetical protein